MDLSFELLSSMSPKVSKVAQPSPKKPPSKLALKKYFRRSSSLPVANRSRKNESVILIESSSTETCSSSSDDKKENETPVVISESELSLSDQENFNSNEDVCKMNFINDTATGLSQEKYKKIKNWVDEVNNAKEETSVFSELSTLCGDDDERHVKNRSQKKTAISSTLLEPTSKRFDQLFKKIQEKEAIIINELEYVSSEVVKSNDSLLSEDNSNVKKNSIFSELEDSLFQLNLDDNKHKCLENTESENDEYTNLLDSLYGDSWRERKRDILPSSEPRPKKVEKKSVNREVARTEKPTKVLNFHNNIEREPNSNNLLETLQRARFKKVLESPWLKSIKNVCDPDTDSEDDCLRNLTSVKLDFRDYENDNKKSDKNISPEFSTKSKGKAKSKKKTTGNNIKNTESNNNKGKSDNGCSSFLASLSASVPVSKCDMAALIYRNNFKEHRESLASKLFKLYNESIFDNAIPADTPLEWNDRMRQTAGYCYCRKITRRTGKIERAARIVLSTKVLDSADRLRDTLVHEMCHAATWIVNEITDGHGPCWKSWAERAMRTFPELPLIRTNHQYVINTKYTYKCTGCGYSIGRHTKSLDVDRNRCGYCYGKFEIFINKTSKNGEKKSVPATPKKPLTGFARFVKENYATHKAPNLKHADVMKILGQKFTELKFV